MTDEVMVERALTDWLESSQAPALRESVVRDAFTAAQKTRQRGRVELALRGPRTWPAGGVAVAGLGRLRWTPLLPAARSLSVFVVIVLLLALLVVAFAGSLLQPRPTYPPFGRNGVIAYTVNDIDGRPYNHIHLVDADGSNDRELAQGSAVQFSVDGSTLIYFTGWGYGSDDLRLVRANPDGTNPSSFTFYQQTGFAMSPDGTQVVLQLASGPGEVEDDVSLVNLVDGTAQVLLAAAAPTQRYWDFRWSPDGTRLAYTVLQEVVNGDNSGSFATAIETVEVATGTRRVVSSRPGTDSSMVTWSPDSQFILFTATPDGVAPPSLGPSGSTESFNPPQDIFAIRPDGEGERNMTNDPGFYGSLAWAPDGSAISYTRHDGAALRIVVQPVRGLERDGEPLTGPPAEAGLWSPDAQRLLITASQDVGGSVLSVDRHFKEAPMTVVESDYLLNSVTWQRLEP